MTVTSLFKANYKRLKCKKVNNGTKSTDSPFPKILPSGIALQHLSSSFFKAASVQLRHHSAELKIQHAK